MVLKNEQYIVTIHTQYQPDIKGYPVLYRPVDLDLNDFYSAYLINIQSNDGGQYSIALLDLLISKIEPCAVLEENVLTVILFRTILQIDLNTRKVTKCVDCENMGGLEEIHPITNGYIIKGEGEIFRYDKELNQIWWRAGRDIFATPEGENCFWLEGDLIHCRDWEGWHYVLNLNGKTIREIKEKTFSVSDTSCN